MLEKQQVCEVWLMQQHHVLALSYLPSWWMCRAKGHTRLFSLRKRLFLLKFCRYKEYTFWYYQNIKLDLWQTTPIYWECPKKKKMDKTVKFSDKIFEVVFWRISLSLLQWKSMKRRLSRTHFTVVLKRQNCWKNGLILQTFTTHQWCDWPQHCKDITVSQEEDVKIWGLAVKVHMLKRNRCIQMNGGVSNMLEKGWFDLTPIIVDYVISLEFKLINARCVHSEYTNKLKPVWSLRVLQLKPLLGFVMSQQTFSL